MQIQRTDSMHVIHIGRRETSNILTNDFLPTNMVLGHTFQISWCRDSLGFCVIFLEHLFRRSLLDNLWKIGTNFLPISADKVSWSLCVPESFDCA